MDAKKCDRCGSFYIGKKIITDNAVDIFDKKTFKIVLGCIRSDGYEYKHCVDLCPKCMNDLKIFMEVQHITPYIVVEDPCKNCVTPHCEQCRYGYKTLEERIEIVKETKE